MSDTPTADPTNHRRLTVLPLPLPGQHPLRNLANDIRATLGRAGVEMYQGAKIVGDAASHLEEVAGYHEQLGEVDRITAAYDAEKARAEKAEAARLAAERALADAKVVIIEANNSLHGSQGYFLSLNGGTPDENHLSGPIEALKERCNQQWHRAEKAEAERDRLVAVLKAGRRMGERHPPLDRSRK